MNSSGTKKVMVSYTNEIRQPSSVGNKTYPLKLFQYAKKLIYGTSSGLQFCTFLCIICSYSKFSS